MRSFSVRPVSGPLKGQVSLLGDKSIAHRSIIISALARGQTSIENFPANKDCLFTLKALKKLGVQIRHRRSTGSVIVAGRGLEGLKQPAGPICVGESGTTLRLLLGVLAGQDFTVHLVSTGSLNCRPMRRVTEPLRLMGARIKARALPQGARPKAKSDEYPPLSIRGGELKAITYKMPVASAQVKSAILLAGLYAQGRTEIIEPIKTRDHTERLLRLFKARIKVYKNKIVIKGGQELVSPRKICIPGDISSASFFMVLAAILPKARLLIRNIGLNPSRAGIITILKRMGAHIKVRPVTKSSIEPSGDILVESSVLKGTLVRKTEIPSLIDELPILMVAACFAQGKTVFEGAQELRLKETDRLQAMSQNLTKMGARIESSLDKKHEKIVVYGIRQLHAGCLRSFRDHRTAMSIIVAGLNAQGSTLIDDVSCIDKSFPGFLRILKKLLS